MKKLALSGSVFAAVALLAQSAIAVDITRHEKCAHMAPGETAEPAKKMDSHEDMMRKSMEKMRAQMAEVNRAKNSKKRQEFLREHNQSMRESLKIMREMMAGMAKARTMESNYKMGGHKMNGHRPCDHKTGEYEMCDHMRDGNPASQPGSNADTPPAAQASQGQIADPAGRQERIWICPMHPGIARDQSGICPICNMDMVEAEQYGSPQDEHGYNDNPQADCMMGGGMKCRMKKMGGKYMDMVLMLMEQMVEHNEAEMAARK